MSGLLYLHCIVEPESAAYPLLHARALPGMDPDAPLFPIEAGGLVAAVSLVPADTFEEAPLNTLLTDLPRLAPFAIRHEEVIQALLPHAAALIPMSFGTVYREEERVRALLIAEQQAFRAMLERVRGRQEWGVKVFADATRLHMAAAQHSDAAGRLLTEANAATPGRAYLLRKQHEKLVEAESRELLREVCTMVLDQLTALSVDVAQDSTLPPQEENRRLVLKAALLVDNDRAQALQEAAAALARCHAPLGVEVEVRGPWAAYSFVRGRGG
jgi:hypothetical protein